uniref:Pre-rRNA-processing protein TSR2 homolog n=1 Tax=Ciona intestinalis TaxID=7719 RepID=F6QZE9_CIOIN|nr:pre-rRNA-processing protein TSR2 homolog [Ciona intestinalis]|eukprot:XP_002119706.1 pre-rRNA-processing protein TSR2 homolog [Ciona intestinalis]
MASTAQSPSLFYQSIQAILKSWTGLQLAVAHGFGGLHSSEKAQWLVGVIETFFKENDDIEAYELEDFIDEIMATEFNTLSEDDGTKVISQEICNQFQYWKEGRYKEMKERLQKLECVNLAECMNGNMETSEQIPDEEANKILEGMTICGPDAISGDTSVKDTEKTFNETPGASDLIADDEWTTVTTRARRKRNK